MQHVPDVKAEISESISTDSVHCLYQSQFLIRSSSTYSHTHSAGLHSTSASLPSSPGHLVLSSPITSPPSPTKMRQHHHPLLDYDVSSIDLREGPPRSPTRHDHAEARLSASLSFLAIRTSLIYQLPAEILLNILSRLSLDSYPSLVAALWHLLRHHGIAPQISTHRLKLILLWPRHGFYDSYAHATSFDPPPLSNTEQNSNASPTSPNGSSNTKQPPSVPNGTNSKSSTQQQRPPPSFIPKHMRGPLLHRLAPGDHFFYNGFTDLKQRLRYVTPSFSLLYE